MEAEGEAAAAAEVSPLAVEASHEAVVLHSIPVECEASAGEADE
jgi:hypothetical protein